MARPPKNNCDYFPHMTTMRNHRKVKMLRNNFGSVLGYAFWSMFVEYLTDADGNEVENSEMEMEMFASELGVSAAEIRAMVDYCIKIELLFDKEGFIYSQSLNDNLAPVWEKRERGKQMSATKERRQKKVSASKTPVSVTETTRTNTIPVTETQQIRLEESKGDNIGTNVPTQISFGGAYKDIAKTTPSISKFINDNKPKDIQPYVDLWNLFAEQYGCAKVKAVSESRKRKLKVRLGDKNFMFTRILGYAKDQKMALKSTWFTFDWLIENDNNYIKVMEKKYLDKDFKSSVKENKKEILPSNGMEVFKLPEGE